MLAVLPVFVGASSVPFLCNDDLDFVTIGTSDELCSSNCSGVRGYGEKFSSIVQEVCQLYRQTNDD